MSEKEIKVVIIDDSPEAIDNISFLMESYPNLHLVGTSSNIHKAKKVVLENMPDLLFLDMEIGAETGLEFWDSIRDQITWKMEVIFHTAFDRYMLEAIRNEAFDYLLKPVMPDQFNLVMKRYLNSLNNETKKIAAPTPINNKGAFWVQTIFGDLQLVRSENVGYFRYNPDRKNWEVIMDNMPRLQMGNQKASDIEKLSPSFMRVHQSFVVNTNYLFMIRDNKCILYPPFDNVSEIVVSREGKKRLMDLFSPEM